jgi:type II secretory pathway component PulF
VKFKYRGLDAAGRATGGEIEAESSKRAAQLLFSKGITPLKLREIGGGIWPGLGAWRRGRNMRLSDGEMEHFFDRLARLCGSGLTLADALESIAQNTSSPLERRLTLQILDNFKAGDSFTQALKKCSNSFTPSMLSILALGDVTGNFSHSLDSVVAFLRRKIDTRKRFIAGISYPLFICAMAFGVVLLFLFYLMPRMSSMMASLGGQLPLVARALMRCSRLSLRFSPLLMLFIAAMPLFLRRLRGSAKHGLKIDRIFLRLPVVGRLHTLAMRAQISNTLASLTSGGVTVTEAISVAGDSITNIWHRSCYTNARDAILNGAAVASAFKIGGIFDGFGADIIAVGEKTGDMAAALTSLAGAYDAQLDTSLKKLVTFTSAATLLFAFSLVAILALSIVSSVLTFSTRLAR